ncbi:MAG TPA: hypothetical protein DFS52_06685 [Myxococcales bacterium]|nr:hypothetical protein [Myxococcales bacterium]
MLRLLRGTETADLAKRYARLLSDPRSAQAATAARELFESQFATRKGVGVEMAIRSARPLVDADEIAASCEALPGDLLAALNP